MRSEFDERSQFDQVISLSPYHPGSTESGRRLSALEFELMVRRYRAVMLGEMIADVCLWLARLPGRCVAALRHTKPPARTALSRPGAH